jgi:hypothetical protein
MFGIESIRENHSKKEETLPLIPKKNASGTTKNRNFQTSSIPWISERR